MDGYGTLALTDGTCFSGKFMHCSPAQEGLLVRPNGQVFSAIYKEPAGRMTERTEEKVDDQTLMPKPIQEPRSRGNFLEWKGGNAGREWTGTYMHDNEWLLSGDFVNWVFPKGACKISMGWDKVIDHQASGDKNVCDLIDEIECRMAASNTTEAEANGGSNGCTDMQANMSDTKCEGESSDEHAGSDRNVVSKISGRSYGPAAERSALCEEKDMGAARSTPLSGKKRSSNAANGFDRRSNGEPGPSKIARSDDMLSSKQSIEVGAATTSLVHGVSSCPQANWHAVAALSLSALRFES